MERLDRSPIHTLLVTDSVETQPVTFSQKVEVVSVAPLFGEAIRRIHNRESISILFPSMRVTRGDIVKEREVGRDCMEDVAALFLEAVTVFPSASVAMRQN